MNNKSILKLQKNPIPDYGYNRYVIICSSINMPP
jgi:hypothetical protein